MTPEATTDTNAPQATDGSASATSAPAPDEIASLTTRLEVLEQRVGALVERDDAFNKMRDAWAEEVKKITLRAAADSTTIATYDGRIQGIEQLRVNISQLEEAKGQGDEILRQLGSVTGRLADLEVVSSAYGDRLATIEAAPAVATDV